MFCLDLETLGISSESVILSAAIVHFDSNKDYTFQDLYENALFVKFRTKDQVENYKRTVNKDTITWWNKQCQFARERSFIPTKYDVNAEAGLTAIKNYISEYEDPKSTLIWARGSLDQMTFDSLCNAVLGSTIVPYTNWMDVRTFIGTSASESKRGYCKIEKEDHDPNLVIKHDPVSDVCLDVMMMMYHS